MITVAIPVWSGVHVGVVGSKLKKIVDAYPGDKSKFYITSAYRPSDTGSHHGGLTYGGSPTAAIDIGFGYPNNTKQARALAEWLYQFSSDIVELIHASNPNGFYVKNQNRVGPYAASDHWNHIHFASSSALADRILAKINSGGGSSGGSSSTSPSESAVRLMPYHLRPPCAQGSKGGKVAHLQDLLQDLKYNVTKDGIYGPQTEAAVSSFQKDRGWSGDGSGVGDGTWRRLEEAWALTNSNPPMIRRGDEYRWVGYAQHALRLAGHDIDYVNGFPFGPQTEAAVRSFQSRKNLQVDGIIGPDTWRELNAVVRAKFPNPEKLPKRGGAPSPPSPSKPGATSPPHLVDLKDRMLEEADNHGLSGLQFLGIAPSSASAYGYHNSRDRHLAGETRDGANDYSVQTPLDKEGEGKYFSAIDLGGSSSAGRAATRKMTERLRDAVESGDSRVNYLREFYGTLNGKDVYGRIHNSLGGSWSSSSADDSHLMHVHLSFFRKYNNDPVAMKAVGDVLLGIDVDTEPPPPPPPPTEEESEVVVPNELRELIEQLITLLKELLEK